MTDIVTLTFPETIITLRIPVTRVTAFEADPLPDVWDKNDDDMMALKNWLDANAPGWTTRLQTVGAKNHDLVIGGSVVTVEYDVQVMFQQAAHRQAFHDRPRSQDNEVIYSLRSSDQAGKPTSETE